MSADIHAEFQRLIDESLIGTITPERERSLREHIHQCSACQEYLDANTRVVAALSGFSFEVDPALHAKVSAALTQRVQQMEAVRPTRRRLMIGSVLALVLSAAGSVLDLQFGRLLASFFDRQSTLVWHGVLAFSIIPSLCVLLLFPLLTLLSDGGTRRNERIL